MMGLYFYHWTVVFILFFLCYMIDFRSGIEDSLRLQKVSKTKIRKSTKGLKNYWWYEIIHREFGLDSQYILNKIFTCLSALTLMFHIIFGWWSVARFVLAVLFTLCLLLYLPMGIFSTVQHNLREHGQSFVVFKRRKHGRRGYDSAVLDFVKMSFPAGLAIIEWKIYQLH